MSTSAIQHQNPPPPPAVKKLLHHGIAFESWWKSTIPDELPNPKIVCESKEAARPGYQSMSATEYCDHPQVLSAKIDFLVKMMKASSHPIAYCGAGISTQVLHDYASRATGSVVRKSEASGNRKLLPPTYNHRVLAALFKAGYLHNLLDQNHDCFSLKAGIPLEKCNFIHGHWFDSRNPVLMMDDKLRPDLLEQMMQWSATADFVFAIGTSLAGMTADVVAEQCAKRFITENNKGQGLAILTIQETRLDSQCALKIYARIEDVMSMLEKKLKLKLESQVYDMPKFPPPKKIIVAK